MTYSLLPVPETGLQVCLTRAAVSVETALGTISCLLSLKGLIYSWMLIMLRLRTASQYLFILENMRKDFIKVSAL